MDTEQAQALFAITFPLCPLFEEECQPFLGLQLMELGSYVYGVFESGEETFYSLVEISSFYHLLLNEGDNSVVDYVYAISLLDQMFDEKYMCVFRSIYERADVSKNLKEYIMETNTEFDYDLQLKRCGGIIGLWHTNVMPNPFATPALPFIAARAAVCHRICTLGPTNATNP